MNRSELEKYISRVSLSEGETHRFNHEGCATTQTSKSLCITRKHDGYVCYCFKCGESGFVSTDGLHAGKGGQSPNGLGGISQRSTKTASGNQHGSRCYPPRDGESDPSKFTPGAAVWIKRFLTEQEIRQHGIICCNRTGRLFFPISPSGWIFRNTQAGAVPKWYTKTPKCFCYSRCGNGTDVCVVTEDVVSAIRCSRYADAYALCGTSLHDNVLSVISRHRYLHAVVFLDDDNREVKRKALEAKRKLELIVPKVTVHHSGGTDPKETSDSELQRILA